MNRFLKCFLLFIICASPVSAQAIECDAFYTSKPGDSLSKIAGQAYGRTTAYQAIFDYNPGVLSKPSLLPIGIDLYIPCLKRTGPSDPLPPAPVSNSGEIKILTGSDYPPYADNGLEEGGFSHALINRAMLFSGAPADFRIDVINDWNAHLQPLIEDGAYDLGFPWFRPDCDQYEKLGERSRWRCDNLRFSEALHEVVVTFFARSDVARSIQDPEDAHGMKICRPRGYFTHDLEVMGLVPPTIVMVAGANPKDCFERLIDGEVDLVTVNADTSDDMITELGISGQVGEVLNLASVQTLRAVGLKSNPRTRILLLRLNKGLGGLREDGTFRSLASVYLR